MNRIELKEYIKNNYNVNPDYPWIKYPSYEVFRHNSNKNGLLLLWRFLRINLDCMETIFYRL